MSTFPRSICWSSRTTRTGAALGMVLAAIAVVSALPQLPKNASKGENLPPFLEDFQAGKPRALPPFLDEFLADAETPLIEKMVRFPSAIGAVNGFWVRPDHKQPLPAVLLVYDDESWTDWMKVNTRHLASIGYEALTVKIRQRANAAGDGSADEATLAELSAAVRWLRGRADVLPNRLGVVSWNGGGSQALVLASATSVQACVVCDAPLPSDRALLVGLRGTPVLGVFSDEEGRKLAALREWFAAQQISCKFHVASGVQPGFMGPPGKKTYAHDAAEEAWVAIYHFLEKHVEDARPAGFVSPAVMKSATIADIMLAVNDGSGIRGLIGKALEQEPSDARQWQRIRANAALMAEAGGWLRDRVPTKGAEMHWKEQAQAFRAAAEALAQAADQRDYAAARRGFQHLSGQCAACHLEHR